MEYTRQSDLKVTCIATVDDMDFFGITVDDILDRTEAGLHFLKKVKELCGTTQKVTWTNKIEGRMKTALYVACVARTYRKAIDDYLESPEKYQANMDWYRAEIAKCTYRQFTTGFYFGKPSEETQIYDNNTYVNEYIYLGIVESIDERGFARFEQRNKFCVGDTIEIMKPDGSNVEAKVLGMYNEEGEAVESCPHSKQVLYVQLDVTPQQYDLMRVKAN